jgi:hypothetical protein
MVCEVESPISPRPIIHSQLVIPRRDVVLPALYENSESLWTRVNRICDRYMPQLFDMRVGPKVWRALGDNSQK